MSILFAGFKGNNNSSKVILDKLRCENKLYLENDKIKSCRQIEEIFLKNSFDQIVFLGQKPLINNCVCIERIAKNDEERLTTNFDMSNLEKLFKDKYISFKFSKRPGTSYCNNIYYYTLNYIRKNILNTKCVFLHIPYLDKFCCLDKLVIALNNLNQNNFKRY